MATVNKKKGASRAQEEDCVGWLFGIMFVLLLAISPWLDTLSNMPS